MAIGAGFGIWDLRGPLARNDAASSRLLLPVCVICGVGGAVPALRGAMLLASAQLASRQLAHDDAGSAGPMCPKPEMKGWGARGARRGGVGSARRSGAGLVP